LKLVANIKLAPNPEEADGIPVLFVDPKYTSKGCPACGTIDDKNRTNQATFSCISCRHAGHADVIAARDIRCRAEAALVTRP
jgi:putative transposase